MSPSSLSILGLDVNELGAAGGGWAAEEDIG
jgi:hypothetical protein